MNKSRIFEAAFEAPAWGQWSPCPKCRGRRQVVKVSIGTLWVCTLNCGTAVFDGMEPSNRYDEEGRPRPIFVQDLREVVESVLSMPIGKSKVPKYACEQGHVTLEVVGLVASDSYVQLQCRNFKNMRIESNQLSPSGFLIEGGAEVCELKYEIHTSTLPEGFVEAYLTEYCSDA